MAVIETWLRQDLKGLVSVRSLQGQVFSLDNGGNLIGVKVTKDGQPVELEGTVIGYCILSDGQTVNVTGDGSSGIQNGNEAYIVLPQLVYSVPGQISIVIKITNGSTTTTLAACTGYVYKSRTSNEVVPPGTPIPDLATMEEVIRRATAATDAANAATVGAEKVDASMTKEGDVITITVTDRDGNVMAETMIDTASDVSELKSSFEQLNDNVITESAGPAPIVSIADGADGMPMRSVEVAIEPVQDLHGYDAPWPAGGGKNIVRPNGFNGIVNNVNIVTNSDGSITCNGTASADIIKTVGSFTMTAGKSYIGNGCPSGGGASLYGLFFDFMGRDNGSGTVTKTPESDAVGSAKVIIVSGYQCTNLTFKPMVRLSTSDAAFAPYSNVCPISGWTGAKVTRTGKNLLNQSARVLSDLPRFIKIGVDSYADTTPNKTLKLDAGTYTFSVSGANSTNYESFAIFDEHNTRVAVSYNNKKCTFALSEAGYFYAALVIVGELFVSWDNYDLMLESGSTATAYEPYQGQTYEVTFPSEAGTVYGGTLDVVSGKLVVDRAMMTFDGTEDWVWDSNNRVARAVANGGVIINGQTQYNIYTKNSTFADRSWAQRSSVDGTLGMYYGMSRIYVKYSKITDAESAKVFFTNNHTTVVYNLAQNIEINLTPTEIKTLLGANNLWADCGDSSITYPADTKMYIDNRINSTRKLIAGIETGFLASKAYSAGDMLIIGDDLYKVASAIASGATITVGTNVNKTTVAEQLLALANA